MTTKSSAKAARRPKAAKGAVLLMVLTVMFVLIFLLAGTIAVVYSARNRVMTKYEETQAYYTARSVLDTFVSEIFLDDTQTYGTGSESYEKDSTDTTKVKTLTDISYARAFELDLYRVPIKTGTLQTGSLGSGIVHVSDKTDDRYSSWIDTYEAKQADGSTKHLYEYDSHYFNMPFGTASSHTGTDWEKYYKQYTLNSTIGATFSATSASDKIEYEVNTLDDYRTGYTGGFNSNKLADIGVKPKITIEVLERMYDIDASVLPASGTPSEADWLDAFAAGDRENDYFRFKVTSTVEYDGQEYSTYVIFQNKMKDPQPAKSRGLVSLSSATGSNTMGFIGGGAMIHKGTGVTAPNGLMGSQDIYLNGDWSSGTTPVFLSIPANKIWFVRGTFKQDTIEVGTKNVQTAAQSGMRFEKGATFYANTIHQVGSGKSLGDSTLDKTSATGGVNVLAVKAKFDGQTTDGVYGRLICETFDVTGCGNDTHAKIHEEAWCNYMELNNSLVTIDHTNNAGADISPLWYVHIDKQYGEHLVDSTAKLNVLRGVIVNGNKYELGAAVDPTATKVEGIEFTDHSTDCAGRFAFTTASAANTIHLDYENCLPWQDVTQSSTQSGMYFNTTDDERYVKFPTGVKVHYKKDDGTYDQREYIALPTPKSIYSTYFADTAFTSTGDFTESYAQDDATYNSHIGTFITNNVRHADLDVDTKGYISFAGPYAAFNAACKENTDTSIAEKMVINQDFSIDAGKYYGRDTSAGTNSGTYTDWNKDPYNAIEPIAIDVRAGDVKMYLNGPGDYYGCFKVYAGNTKNKLHIIMDGTGEYKFAPTSGNATWYVTDALVENGKILSKQTGTYSVGDNNVAFSIINGAAPQTTSPHINYYAGKNVTQVTIEQKASNALEGYFYLPDSKLIMVNGVHFPTKVTIDEGTPMTNTKTSSDQELMCVGSILCKEFECDTSLKPFVLYVPDGAGAKASQNKAMFQWYSKLYGA